MNSEKQDTTIKPIVPGKPTEDQGNRSAPNAGVKTMDSQQRPEGQNVDPKGFVQKDKPTSNGSPSNQKV